MTNLFALCRPDGELVVKRVQITQPVQAKIAEIFQAQGRAFLNDVTEEHKRPGARWAADATGVRRLAGAPALAMTE